jgi:hypothetical protein
MAGRLLYETGHVKESGDKEFAQKCIEAILAAEGIVVAFPPIPNTVDSVVTETKQIS